MFRKIKKLFVPIISLLLVFVMVFMTACSNNSNNSGNGSNPSEGTIVTPGDGNQGGGPSIDEGEDDSNGSGGHVDPPEQNFDDLLDYEVDESANFVYNLVNNDLQQQYSTFVGYISAETSKGVVSSKGLAYTDYSQGYIDDDGKTYFSAGFIAIPSEEDDEIANGVGNEIHSMETAEDGQFSYVYAYDTEDLHKQAVAYGKLFEYDIVNGVLQYSEKEYSYGMPIDDSRGDLWSYDTNEYLYRTEPQGYVPTTGVGLLGEAEYQEIVDAVNKILKSQEANLKYTDLQTFTAYAVEALNSYILGLQEETFMGIPTESLKEFAKDLNPLEHLQIQMDEEGNIRIGIIKVEKLATVWEKILTSVVCAYAVVAGVCCNILGDVFPVAKVLFGAAGGGLVATAMEAFQQVVISGTSVDTMSLERLAVAAVSGSIAGALSVKIGSMNSVIVRNTVDTVVDGVIGGGEFFVNALIDGESLSQALTKFGYGLATGIVVSAVFKGVTFVAKKGTSWIKKTISDIPDTVNDRPIKELTEETTSNAASQKVAMDGAQKSVNKFDPDYLDECTSISAERKNHILEGDSKWNGGHASRKYQDMLNSGTSLLRNKQYADGVFEIEFMKSNGKSVTKTFFPASWSDDKILEAAKHIGAGSSFFAQPKGTFAFYGIYDGVPMWVVKDELKGRLVTAYPMNGIDSRFIFPTLMR